VYAENKLKGIHMDTRYRILSSAGSITDFFLCPTEFLYNEFATKFGYKVADEVFYSLYKKTRSSLIYRQITPINILADQNTKKYVFKLYDNRQIETVCIKRRTGTTVCLSTQSGCSVRCIFCESGKNGLHRNLSASEIIQQFLFVSEDVNRIVFMGIGEPLNNYEEVLKAIHILRDRKGVDFPTDGITISTVGPIPALHRLKQESLKIQLTLSLHATDQATRNELIPGMVNFSINETISEALSWQRKHNRKLTIAYLLLPGINDFESDSQRLVQWFGHKNVIINLMSYNGVNTSKLITANDNQLYKFMETLEKGFVEVSIRKTNGSKINAACGQLIAKEI
jgi:23S rRNA (adenine2503-C2)-methyltransferase